MNLHLEPDSLPIAIPFPGEIRCAATMGKINALHCAELLDQDASEKQIPRLEPSKKGGSVGLEQVMRQVGANQIILVWTTV